MKPKKKTISAVMIAFLACLGITLLLTVSTIVPVIAAMISVDEEQDAFIAEMGGYHYKCYKLKNESGTPVSGVAIAWNEDADSAPSTLNIDSSISYSGASYTIRGIATAGFRYCTFTEINLPTTIEFFGEEAFAYCEKMTVFKMPHLVDIIPTSCFLDCRALEYVKYLDENGDPTLTNDSITRIEDHAFDSCVSLKSFTCPTNVTYFGESCFQRCEVMPNFFFPKEIKLNNVTQNKITVRPYAFADCSGLLSVYFEPNMDEIDNYAFVKCHTSMTIRFTGTSVPNNYKRDNVKQTHWRDKNIANGLTSVYTVIHNHPEIDTSPEYPNLHYSLVSTPEKLDCTYDKNVCQIYAIDQATITADGGSYAVINGFDTPMETNGCFDISNGTLTIPETIDGHPVRAIDLLAFAYNLDIHHVVFSANLMQIRHHAFYRCTNIETLTFTSCTSLREVSYQVFQDKSFTNPNVKSLLLPDCLEFVGDYAFANFNKVENFHLSMGMRAIGDCAFYAVGMNADKSDVDLVLPYTLNDADAQKAYFMHIGSPTGNYPHTDYSRWYSIGKYAFNQVNCVRSVTMQADPIASHATDDNYATSMFSNAFKTAKKVLRFKCNSNLKYIGKDAFKECESLKEVFLTTAKADTATEDYPWCIDENNGNYGGTLFFGASPELVVYLDGDHAPGLLDSYSLNADPIVEGNVGYQVGHTWNAESADSYNNEVQDYSKENRNMQNRSNVPTYYGVDFDNDIVYWKPKDNTFLTTPPTSPDDYNAGIVSIVRTGTNEYTVARYYYTAAAGDNSTGYYKIDLTNITGISDSTHSYLKTIGPEAFGRSPSLSGANNKRNRAQGLYFILPESITTIDERAFYRRVESQAYSNGRFGVRVITYKKSNGNVIASDGTTEVALTDFDDQIIKPIEKNSSNKDIADKDKRGYCVLPPNLTYIGKNAFYNHIFQKVYIGANVSFIGHGAFYTHPNNKDNPRATVTDITITGNSNFESAGGGIYYKGGGDSKRTLLYQAAASTGTFTIPSTTKAIGVQAVANTKYDTISLNEGLQTIYGSAFARNLSLTTVNTSSSIRYINAMENPIYDATNHPWNDDGYNEIWDSTVSSYFDISDYRNVAFDAREIIETQVGAFSNCTSLVTMDFTTMNQIRKIGRAAFYNCTAMKEMSGSTNYIYKEFKNGAFSLITGRSANNENVLDLSGYQNLRSIDMEAFRDCNSVKFLHLPDNKQSGDTESTLYIGYDPESPRCDGNNNIIKGQIFTNSKSIRVLLKETCEYACYDFGGKNHNSKTHYPDNCFGTGNTIYYYAGSAASVVTSGSAIKYWTTYMNGSTLEYILLNNEADARTFFNTYGS